MLDRERVLAKIDQLEGYLRELHQIVPERFCHLPEKSGEKKGL